MRKFTDKIKININRNKSDNLSNLSSDISKIENNDVKINDEFEIEEIISLINPSDIDYDLISKTESFMSLQNDISNKELKRGDEIYITALIRKKGQSMTSPATQSVLKVRIIDIYQGLSYLNKVLR